jgi:hypothetical protein
MVKNMKNEALLQRIRDSEVQGPFQIDEKSSVLLGNEGLEFLVPVLKRWEQGGWSSERSSLESSKDVAAYLEGHYLGRDISEHARESGGYSWVVVGERNDLFRRGKVLKLRDVPHPTSNAVRYNLPDTHIWLRIRPSF